MTIVDETMFLLIGDTGAGQIENGLLEIVTTVIVYSGSDQPAEPQVLVCQVVKKQAQLEVVEQRFTVVESRLKTRRC